MCTKPAVAFSDRKCFNCGKSGHVSKDPIRACTEPAAEPVNAVDLARRTVPANIVGQGRLSGFWMIAEGLQLENEWRDVKASRATRPMPKQATLADFLDRNTFAALNFPDSLAQPAAKPAQPASQQAQHDPRLRLSQLRRAGVRYDERQRRRPKLAR